MSLCELIAEAMATTLWCLGLLGIVCLLELRQVDSSGSPCSSDWDCSLNGVCQNTTCQCDPAWDDGGSCRFLQFEPVEMTACGPGCVYHGDAKTNTSTTWGGSPVVR